jgi:hypothetical protein
MIWANNYHFYKFNLDDITVSQLNNTEEYNEIIEDVEILQGSEVIVDFPSWTPTYWQDPNYKDIWQEYDIKACTLLDDYNSENDCKNKQIELYFPFFHDVGAININSPTSGSAQTFLVNGSIKNFGQYDECCFNTYVEIAEEKVEIFYQDFSNHIFPPNGWTKTHDNWKYSDSKQAGGEYGEAKFSRIPELMDIFRLYTPAIDTSNCDTIDIEFKQKLYHFKEKPCTLQVETSVDGINWDVVWSINPIDDFGPETKKILTGKNVGSTTYVSWTFKGNSSNTISWYIDDISIGYPNYNLEYQDNKCINTIEPGEELNLEFDEWAPEFLVEETTSTREYSIKIWTEMIDPIDENSNNDLFTKIIKLDFFHDVSIKKITNPCGFNASKPWPVEEWLHFDDGTNVNGIGACGTFEYAIRLTPDELKDCAGHSITVVKRHHGYYNADPFWMKGTIKIYAEGTSDYPGKLITEEPFDCYETDWHDIELSEPVVITGNEDIWVSCKVSHKAGQYPAGMDPFCDYYGKGDWVNLGGEWYEIYTFGFYTDWNLWAGITPWNGPWPDTYIQPGKQDINVTVGNFGTFPERDLTCYTEIFEFINDPENGILVYEDNITDFDLDLPLEGIEDLEFNNFTFSKEGVYGLFLNITDDNDDYLNNNEEIWGIGVDNTPPSSWHELYPQEPNGENGWYVTSVEFTICAEDPDINPGITGSGVKEIFLRIDGGVWQVYPYEDCVTIIIEEDSGETHIEYYAIDNVGNTGIINEMILYMDQIKPDISARWESYKKGLTWYVKFTCDASDRISGMDRVEMYINDELTQNITGSGPYEFVIKWSTKVNTSMFKFVSYDIAGNSAFDLIDGSDVVSRSQVKNRNYQYIISNLLQCLLERFPRVQRLLDFLRR